MVAKRKETFKDKNQQESLKQHLMKWMSIESYYPAACGIRNALEKKDVFDLNVLLKIGRFLLHMLSQVRGAGLQESSVGALPLRPRLFCPVSIRKRHAPSPPDKHSTDTPSIRHIFVFTRPSGCPRSPRPVHIDLEHLNSL